MRGIGIKGLSIKILHNKLSSELIFGNFYLLVEFGLCLGGKSRCATRRQLSWCRSRAYSMRAYHWVPPHMNLSCCTCEWVTKESLCNATSSILMPIQRIFYESCNESYEGVMSHIWMSHATHMNELFRTYELVMSHVWIRRFTRIWCRF